MMTVKTTAAPKMGRRGLTEFQRLKNTPGVVHLKGRRTRLTLGTYGDPARRVTKLGRVDLWYSPARGQLAQCWILTETFVRYSDKTRALDPGTIESWEAFHDAAAALAHYPHGTHQAVSDGLNLPRVVARAREYP